MPNVISARDLLSLHNLLETAFFQNHFSETPNGKFDCVTLCIPMVLKCATKFLKISSQIRVLCKKISLNGAFSIMKM